jgi:nitronate monooxygenase
MTLPDILGTDFPIIQAPMAGVQDSALAIAVSNAGGLGSLPTALLAPDAHPDQLTRLGNGTSRPFNVNYFCHAPPPPGAERVAAWKARLKPYYDEFGIDPSTIPDGPGRESFDPTDVELLRQFTPRVVSFHFGLPPAELLAPIKAWGGLVLSSATTVAEALWLEAHGADLIVAQGAEAGGHRGMFLTEDLTTQVGTFALIPQIARRVRVPVIAAGGIADAAGVAAALKLGAAGVQVGTAWLLCPEATTGPLHRAALRSDAARHTALTNVLTGRPARGIVNRVIRELGPMNPEVPPFPLPAPAMYPLRIAAERRGSTDFSSLWAGQNPTGCREIPAGELLHQLAG